VTAARHDAYALVRAFLAEHAPTIAGFALLRGLTPGLSGAARVRLFHRLPRRLQDACWRELARRIDVSRAKADRR